MVDVLLDRVVDRPESILAQDAKVNSDPLILKKTHPPTPVMGVH